jgi:2'-5' RNA ligase
MPAEGPESGIVVRVAVPPALERLRKEWDRAAGAGVPAHVTVLYPFAAPADLDAGVRRVLAEVAAAHEPFDVRFARVGRFPTVVYLAPDPAAPFNRLTDAIHARFPDFPPYEGAFDVVIPHLTITESATAPLDEIEREAAAHLPFERRVTSLEVLVEDVAGRWRSRWRTPLGRRSEVP